MKIRTGFVTNSSSYSSAVITIQSKKFVTLLKEYEDVVGPDRLGGINGIIKGYTFSVICDDEQAPEWCEAPSRHGNQFSKMLQIAEGSSKQLNIICERGRLEFEPALNCLIRLKANFLSIFRFC